MQTTTPSAAAVPRKKSRYVMDRMKKRDFEADAELGEQFYFIAQSLDRWARICPCSIFIGVSATEPL